MLTMAIAMWGDMNYYVELLEGGGGGLAEIFLICRVYWYELHEAHAFGYRELRSGKTGRAERWRLRPWRMEARKGGAKQKLVNAEHADKFMKPKVPKEPGLVVF
ncbi:hypothetical protein V7S43_012719 [Phytophthora oleae]|uniref:Uncharacterized protein n=1 Tax=Phytophthora oleae TaxID=2107226 RepID=A0ABD3F8V5_9STRA